jgi:hypothetical protein
MGNLEERAYEEVPVNSGECLPEGFCQNLVNDSGGYLIADGILVAACLAAYLQTRIERPYRKFFGVAKRQ